MNHSLPSARASTMSTVLVIGLTLYFSVGFIAAASGVGTLCFLLGRLTKERASAAANYVPSIRYPPQVSPNEPLMTLLPGQELVVPWPFAVQVLLMDGAQLQVLEATAHRIRVKAIACL